MVPISTLSVLFLGKPNVLGYIGHPHKVQISKGALYLFKLGGNVRK